MSNKNFFILTTTLASLVFYFISHFSSQTVIPAASGNPDNLIGRSIPNQVGNDRWSSSSSLFFTVSRVIDGDTVQIDTGETVRYIGMNTPETVDPRRPAQCFGHEASGYNKKLVENKKVKLVADITNKDKYGRLLRYVYLEDGTFVNLKLVQDGYANIYTFPPNVAHQQEFAKAQREAKAAWLGLWSSCQ